MTVSADVASIPWVEKYRPKRLSDFIGNRDEVEKIEKWLLTWKSQRKKALWLTGPPGVGKTSVISYLVNKYRIETFELNASDKRNKKAIETLVGRASQEGSLTQGSVASKLILIDEADGLFGNEDRGGARALANVIEKTRVPIICTANDPNSATLKAVRNYVLVVNFKRLTLEQILTLLKRIVKKESLSVPLEILVNIAKNSAGDARSAINDLEGYVAATENIPIELSPRDQENQLNAFLQNIFAIRTISSGVNYINTVDADYRELLTYLYEHAYSQAQNPAELERFYHLIALADFYLSQCYLKQDWRYLRYFFTFLGSIGVYKRSPVKNVRYGFPSYWAMLGRFKGKKNKIIQLAQKSFNKLHCGEKEFEREIYPYLKMIFYTNPRMAAGIAVWLEFAKEDIEFLVEGKKRLVKAIMEYYEEAYKLRTEKMLQETPSEDSPMSQWLQEAAKAALAKKREDEQKKETDKEKKSITKKPTTSKRSPSTTKKPTAKKTQPTKKTTKEKKTTKTKREKRVQKSLDEFFG